MTTSASEPPEESLRPLQNGVILQVLANHPLPVWIYDAETREFLQVNKAAVAEYGFSEIDFLSKRIDEIEVPAARAPVRVLSREGRDPVRPDHHRRRDGSIRLVSAVSYPVEYGGRNALLEIVADAARGSSAEHPGHSFRDAAEDDLTERTRREEHLQQAHKMEAVGRLAGGIAHDFNNLLTIILGYCSLLGTELGRGDGIGLKSLEEIQKAASRAAALTGQILAFSRKQPARSNVVDPNAAIRGVESMLRRLISEDIRLELDLAADIGVVNADLHQMEQAIVNLAVNARDAMPFGGTLTIETRNISVESNFAGLQSLREGQYVQLSVTDTGVGMDPETRARVFHPFFTTKDAGRGTGLGLSMVQNFARRSSGAISVYSEPGRGSAFRLYLPRTDAVDVKSEQPQKAPSFNAAVLIVEDEREIRDLMNEVLRDAGYRVLVAANAAEAIKLSESCSEPIDLLITDVVLPGISGPALAESLTRVRPEMKVLLASGYSNSSLQQDGTVEEGVPFLQKPFSTKVLLKLVNDLIESSRATADAGASCSWEVDLHLLGETKPVPL